MRLRGWVHRKLNAAVDRWGDVPLLGRVLWFAFENWQRIM